MKVILVKDVARLGRKSEVKDVPDGHALNFLIPRKLAIIATPDQLRKVAEEVKKRGEQSEGVLSAFDTACATLKGSPVTLYAEANEQGHLFKGVNAEDVRGQIQHSLGIALDVKSIELEHPIKSVGTHTIPLSYKDRRGECTLIVAKK
jgi:large subunit ribosomal protein L9